MTNYAVVGDDWLIHYGDVEIQRRQTLVINLEMQTYSKLLWSKLCSMGVRRNGSHMIGAVYFLIVNYVENFAAKKIMLKTFCRNFSFLHTNGG